MKARIEAAFGGPALRRSALRLHGGEDVLREVFHGRRTALEIGTYRGATAAFLAQLCERVITVDLRSGQLEREVPGFDRRAFWDALGLRNIEFHAVANDHEKAALIAGLAFDGAFIDGAHETAAVERDFRMVSRCGYVLFHDYGAPSVRRFIDTLQSVQPMGDFALWTA